MWTMTDFYLRRALPVLRRNPVLTALILYSIGIGMAVSIAALAVWRSHERPYVVQTALPDHAIIETRGLT
jgi:multisubunit Na+/H+ antiporter MnhC subunit